MARLRGHLVKKKVDQTTHIEEMYEYMQSSAVPSAVPSSAYLRRGKLAGVKLTGDPIQELLSRLTVPALRSALRSRRLFVSRLKAELVQRLLSCSSPPSLAEIDALVREHAVSVLGLRLRPSSQVASKPFVLRGHLWSVVVRDCHTQPHADTDMVLSHLSIHSRSRFH